MARRVLVGRRSGAGLDGRRNGTKEDEYILEYDLEGEKERGSNACQEVNG